METSDSSQSVKSFNVLFPIFVFLCGVNVLMNLLGLSLVKYVFLAQSLLLVIILISSDQSDGLWGLALYALFEGQGRVIWGYNIVFRLNFDLMLGILIIRSIISNKKLINREVLPNYLVIGIFLHFVWFALELFNPNGAGFFPSFATAKIYIFPFLLFFYFQNFPIDPRSPEVQKRIFMFCFFFFLMAIIVIVQAQLKEDFLYGISPYYKDLFAKYSNFSGYTYRPWGLSFVPGGMSTLFYQAIPFLLLLDPVTFSKGSSLKKLFYGFYKQACLLIVLYASFISQVRSATIKLALIIGGFYFLKFLGSRLKFKRIITFLLVGMAITLGSSTITSFLNLEEGGATKALERYEGLGADSLLAGRLDFDTFFRVFDDRIELPFGYGLGMAQNFLPDFEARRKRYLDKPKTTFWSNDNLIVFLLVELGLGAIIYLFIVFAVNLSLFARLITLLRWKELSAYSTVACCTIICFFLTVFNWGAVALPFNPESFFFWFWVAMGFSTYRDVKMKKMA